MTALEFNHKVASLQPMLESFTMRFVKDPEEGKDLVQETILKALTYRDKFVDNSNLKGWLFTIMRNTFINNYRKSKRAKTSHDDTQDLYYLNVEDTYTFNLPGAVYEYDEMLSAIDEIKDDFKVPFQMHVEGYKYHEIADKLNIPIGTVKTRIFYARKEIKKRLEDKVADIVS